MLTGPPHPTQPLHPSHLLFLQTEINHMMLKKMNSLKGKNDFVNYFPRRPSFGSKRCISVPTPPWTSRCLWEDPGILSWSSWRSLLSPRHLLGRRCPWWQPDASERCLILLPPPFLTFTFHRWCFVFLRAFPWAEGRRNFGGLLSVSWQILV